MSTAPVTPTIPLARVLTDEGLRLFFPLGAIYAALWPLQWVLIFGLDLPFVRHTPPALWHAHEMIYGAFGAALLGFISTAVPEWTDTRRPSARFLFWLAGLWLGGRLVGFLGADPLGWLGALCDLAWLSVLAGYVAWVSWHKRSTKLLGFCGWISALAIAEALIRYAFAAADLASAQRLLHVAGFVFMGLLGLALARITVSVNNLILDPGKTTSPYRPHPGRINLASGLMALVAIGELAGLSATASAYLLIAAGAAFMDRAGESFIGREAVRAEILVLTGASLFAGGGLILLGLSSLGVPLASSLGLHMALMGGLGLGVMAVYSIAGLLHTGQKLVFARGTKLAALLLVLAVVARVLPLLGWNPPLPGNPYGLAALLWAAAFLVWLKIYWPLLSGAWTLPARQIPADADAG
ncbi:short-chain dehydrogenase [Steroidobacter denitrificans]|uniref:Short-chain dehydrogenase n=1 Tax=Steroidobacter denitrificans TaxID=465721 RepID=A0A127FC01_STEDE|nr:NnrS family protein [Steroidobacter denitrificans]AMN47942.1 short-chain dehydrogenase [Steroidobacter denitrificans]